jgi:DNA-binding transcriptional LysR family regulator
LKVSMGTGFGRTYIVPLLKDFLQRYPAIAPDWHFDNRRVDLVAEGFDAAIGGGFELPPSMVARTLAPAHGVLVAAPDYFSDKAAPTSPADLDKYNGILVRSPQTGRVRSWPLQHRAKHAHEQAPVTLRPSIIVSDPDAACEAMQQGLGIALVSMPSALRYLEQEKVVRVLPDWYVDMGTISLYFAGQKLLPAKTRAFVDFVVEHFRQQNLAKRFSAF